MGARTPVKVHGLTERQWAIAELVGQCVRPKEIATRLGLSADTVYGHTERIVLAWHLDPNLDAHSQIALRVAELKARTA